MPLRDPHREAAAQLGRHVPVEYAVDFSAVTGYAAWFANHHGSTIIIKVEGTRWYSRRIVNPKTGQVLQATKDGGVDVNVAAGGSVERPRRAFADFRANRCRGHAL